MPNTYIHNKTLEVQRDAQVGPRKPVGKMPGASVRTLGLRFRLAS